MKKIFMFCFILAVSFLPVNIAASSKQVYIGGESVGIKMDTEVEVSRMYEISGKKPWSNTSLEVGSIITKIDEYEIDEVSDVNNAISNKRNDYIKINYITDGESYQDEINPIESQGVYSIGLSLRDNIEGIGTLTFIDPTSSTYGALGHRITTNNSDGKLTTSSVTGIEASKEGVPGFKKSNSSNEIVGNITKNDFTGIYGQIDDINLISNKRLIEVGNKNDVKTGRATILTVLSNKEVREFEIEILEVKDQESKDIKGMKIKVVDNELLEVTGGIVQGMSGSPIIQDNKLIGAVTHVIVDNPETGYGIFIDWMLN